MVPHYLERSIVLDVLLESLINNYKRKERLSFCILTMIIVSRERRLIRPRKLCNTNNIFYS